MANKTQASVDAAIDSTGKAALGETEATFAMTTSLVTFIPIEGDFTDAVTNTDDFTVSASAGTITCNFTGKISCSGEGSFSLSTNAELVGHFFRESTDLSKGFIRDITNFGNFGSISAPAVNVSVTIGDVISFRLKVDTGTPTLTFHDYAMKIERF